MEATIDNKNEKNALGKIVEVLSEIQGMLAIMFIGIIACLSIFNYFDRLSECFFIGVGLGFITFIVSIILCGFVTKPLHRRIDATFGANYIKWMATEESNTSWNKRAFRKWTPWEILFTWLPPVLILLTCSFCVRSGLNDAYWIIDGKPSSIGETKFVRQGHSVEYVNSAQIVGTSWTAKSASDTNVQGYIIAVLEVLPDGKSWMPQKEMSASINTTIGQNIASIVSKMTIEDLHNPLVIEKRLAEMGPPKGTKWKSADTIQVGDLHVVP